MCTQTKLDSVKDLGEEASTVLGHDCTNITLGNQGTLVLGDPPLVGSPLGPDMCGCFCVTVIVCRHLT